jgi:hypothetical protein
MIKQKSNIYLSGKIGGLETFDSYLNFEIAKWALLAKHRPANITVINPLDIKPLFGIKQYWFFMITDIIALLKCDTVYFLSNWTDSRGAKIEMRIALLFKKRIIMQPHN